MYVCICIALLPYIQTFTCSRAAGEVSGRWYRHRDHFIVTDQLPPVLTVVVYPRVAEDPAPLAPAAE